MLIPLKIWVQVIGMSDTFIKERPLPTDMAGLTATAQSGMETGPVTVDDATLFLAKFTNGTLGSFEATPGNVVHTGDFKFDQAATDLYKPEIAKMASIGEEGVLCLLSDSTGAERPGYTPSEAVVSRDITEAFHAASGRIIVACFASNINRIQHPTPASSVGKNDVFVGRIRKDLDECQMPKL